MRRDRYALGCLLALTLWWGLLAIEPRYRTTWLHENFLVFAGVPGAILLHLRLRFDRLALTMITLFLAMHLVGAHYSYSEVPWLGHGRNHYDRVVHFAYGLLVLRPAVELLRYAAPPRGVWRWLMPPLFMLSHAAIYELLEWAATALLGAELGDTYLGAQGDPWDAEWDVLMAVLGSLLALAVLAWSERRARRRARAPR